MNGSLLGEVARIGAPIGVLLLGIAAFLALRSTKETPGKADQQAAAPLVETIVVEPHTGGLDFSVDGVVVPFREIDLSAEVSG